MARTVNRELRRVERVFASLCDRAQCRQLVGQCAIIFTLARQQMLHLSSYPTLGTPSAWQAWEVMPTHTHVHTHRPVDSKGPSWVFCCCFVCLSSLFFTVCRWVALSSSSHCSNEDDKQPWVEEWTWKQRGPCSAEWNWSPALWLTMRGILCRTEACAGEEAGVSCRQAFTYFWEEASVVTTGPQKFARLSPFPFSAVTQRESEERAVKHSNWNVSCIKPYLGTGKKNQAIEKRMISTNAG